MTLLPLEVQIHAPDIRRGVRYLFLHRRHAWLGTAAIALLAGATAWGLSTIPFVARNRSARQEYRQLERVRGQQGERLKSLLFRLDQVAAGSQALRLRMEKVYLAYGLPPGPTDSTVTYAPVPPDMAASIYADTIAHGNRLRGDVEGQLHVIGGVLHEVQGFEAAHQDEVALTPSICPLGGRDFVLTSPFGAGRNPFTKETDFHAGLDLAAPVGVAVHATAAGVVAFAGHFEASQTRGWFRFGNLVIIRHGDRFVSLYGHLQDVAVHAGQKVDQGQQIGTVGNSGWSTSPHLYYEVRRKDGDDYRPIDPRLVILDHRWRDEERLLVRARTAPDPGSYEPLPAFHG